MINLFNYQEFPITLHVKVIPKAKIAKIKQVITSTETITYKIYVTAPAEDGKANQAVISLIAKTLGIAKSRIFVKQGLYCKDKIIQINAP